ncbi:MULTISPECIES: TetR/AcrR family transcriptional regulator [Paraburkholderia]|uniref:TetR family transcriptional regulator n=1 Tax=Paraburkholderia tropica TaxID=92647 RepID=A0ABX5MJ62_9BURK|nr:TetR/AcrR family transcriptional regulator [Paraburkholderia tropica]MBB2981928.1 AcrR family transcriptional regulator [Paraburkholderia tropica]MBB3003538.1 AcrR family transcriptional regulator [Paraburkholderia tropica]MDE1144043.1 helix-turn-helix domain containing protein [Paraburkholderia tropica]OBR51171.1 TetR family transcriptional regulator [Paraburkholderia tropica]PXX11510.1 TetR family transcriptional regulator [Paraburkholderia tropica]
MTTQPKNQRQIQKEATRQRILSSALELFVSRGYVATTVDDIAAAANTTRVTFYSHFESRRELMRAVIHELDTILERRDEPGRSSTASSLVAAVREGSHEMLDDWLRAQAARWPLIKPYLLAVTEAAAVDAEMRALMRGWIEEVVADIREGLDAANRYEPGTRHFRGELAYVALEQTALSWMRGELDLTSEPALDVLAELWWKMLGAT